MGLGISAQGTLVERDPLGAGSFEVVAELRDISGPTPSRNPIETTVHNDADESFVVGIRRHGELTFQIGYIPTEGSHDATTGLLQSWQNGDRDVWRVTFPEGTEWVFSGFVTNMGPSMPVDDALVADVTIQTTNTMLFP